MSLHCIIGIDYGTCNSSVAAWDAEAGVARVLGTEPSDVAVDPATGLVVGGLRAREIRLAEPAAAIWEARHLEVDGHWMSPQEVAAVTLRRMKEIAESALGGEISDAVLSVPASFTSGQRGVLEEAARLAGLNPLRLVPDPVAAATGYGLERGACLVYQLGGAAFEVSVVQAQEGEIQVVATDGDPRLGGEDFDELIANWALEQCQAGGPTPAQLKIRAEEAKIRLTSLPVTEVVVGSQPLILTREQFERLIDPLLQRSVALTERVVEGAAERGVPREAVLEHILLVGGSAQIPRVYQVVARQFGARAVTRGDPLLVVRGAAALARRFELLAAPGTMLCAGAAVLAEHTLGIGVQEGRFRPLIARGTPLPASATLPFTNSEGATETVVRVYRGENGLVSENTPVGTVTLGPLEPRPAGYHQLEVTFSLDERDQVSVDVEHRNTGRSYSVPVRQESPPVAPRHDENVQFTVYRPAAMQAEKWYSLLAFAHLADRPPDAPADEPDPIAEVQRQARQVLAEQAESYRDVTQDSTQAIPRQGELTFLPEMAGVEFNPPRQTFLWTESVHRAEFRMRASAELERQVARGRLTVFLGSIIVGDVPLSIRVGGESRPRPERSTVAAYRKIFASYSHRDLAIVEECERYARAVGDEYVRDMLHLRTGEVWDDRLRQMIEEADVFQLFWSWNSMRSPFVRREWEHALSLGHKGRAFVRPVYWEEPLPADPAEGLPPAELGRLHFQRLWLAPPRREREDAAAGEINELQRSFESLCETSGGLRSSEECRRVAGELREFKARVRRIREQHPAAALDSIAQEVHRFEEQFQQVRRSIGEAEILNPLVSRYNELVKSVQGGIRSLDALDQFRTGMQSLRRDLGAVGGLHTAEARKNYEKLCAAVDVALSQTAPGEQYLAAAAPPETSEPIRRGRNSAVAAAVILALAALFGMTAVSWWQRIPWRPLAATAHWGAWILAGVSALLGLLLLLGTLVSRRTRSG